MERENLSTRHQRPGDAKRPKDTLDRGQGSAKARSGGTQASSEDNSGGPDRNFGKNGE